MINIKLVKRRWRGGENEIEGGKEEEEMRVKLKGWGVEIKHQTAPIPSSTFVHFLYFLSPIGRLIISLVRYTAHLLFLSLPSCFFQGVFKCFQIEVNHVSFLKRSTYIIFSGGVGIYRKRSIKEEISGNDFSLFFYPSKRKIYPIFFYKKNLEIFDVWLHQAFSCEFLQCMRLQ